MTAGDSDEMPMSCRRYIEEEELSEDLRKYLPREDGKAVEKPAEAALRTKMCAPCHILDAPLAYNANISSHSGCMVLIKAPDSVCGP